MNEYKDSPRQHGAYSMFCLPKLVDSSIEDVLFCIIDSVVGVKQLLLLYKRILSNWLCCIYYVYVYYVLYSKVVFGAKSLFRIGSRGLYCIIIK